MGFRSRAKSDRRHRHSDLDSDIKVRSEDDLYTILDESKVPLVLFLDTIQDPHNFGACLRTADAAGVDAVVIPKDRSVPLTDTVKTVACGAAESVPIIQVTNLARTLREVKGTGIWLVGTADEAEDRLYTVDLKVPIGIVMGAEGKGLRRLTRDHCDRLVRIPMTGKVGCLNVSVATGVVLFEAVRQRQSNK